MQIWLCPLLGFLLGSIPFGVLIAKAKGIDIRAHGSGNIGATNVLRVVGKKYGVICFLLDLLKGFVPVAIAVNLIRLAGHAPAVPLHYLDPFARHFGTDQQLLAQSIQVFTALAAILGHNYSPWIGFKGGKGIATSAGVLFGLMPVGIVLLLLLWGVVFLATRYVSVASICAAAMFPVLTHLGARFHHVNNDMTMPTLWEAGTWNKPLFIFSLVTSTMAILRHRVNIMRLIQGTETRFVPKSKRPAHRP